MQNLTWLCVWIAATVAFADDLASSVPFVSGFDCFGMPPWPKRREQHHEIRSRLS